MEKIGFLGLGVMGSNVVANLLKAGHEITVYNRTTERAEAISKQGARQAQTPREAVADADVIMIMVSDDKAIEDMVFGPDGALKGARQGQIAIDLTTCLPATSLREAAAFNERGVEFLDAPVFGSKNESRDAGLWIVIGGKQEVYEKMLPIFRRISETQHYMGENSKGTSMKLVGNLIVQAQVEALGEAMTLATKAGLNAKDVLGVLAVTDFKSPVLSGVGDSLARRDFSPFFYLKLMLKDAYLIANFAQQLNVPLPTSAATRELIKTAVNKGWGDENASALIKVLEEMAGVEVRY